MHLRIVVACVVASLTGCGLRSVPPPATPAGYEHVALRDIGALGLDRRNVEVVGSMGALSSLDDCGGVLTYRLQGAAIGAVFQGGANIGAAMSSMMQGGGTVTLSIPRSRYAEVRNLGAFARVRVRGYLSRWLGKGCSIAFDSGSSDRYLWVDSIEAAPAGS